MGAAVHVASIDSVSPDDSAAAGAIAGLLIAGFDKHYRLFRQASADGHLRFEHAAWAEGREALRERIDFYDRRVHECVDLLREVFPVDTYDKQVWQEVKLFYIGLLVGHKQPELAETFFNSVITRILKRTYADNDLIFVRATISTEAIETTMPIYRSYYPGTDGPNACLIEAFRDFGWSCPFVDLERDVAFVVDTLDLHTRSRWTHVESNNQVQVLSSAFYRGKAAYVLGRIVNGHETLPLVVPVLHEGEAADLYTMLGLAKQGKTLFFRELIQHLQHSRRLRRGTGHPRQVMLVFTLPSFPYVFKIIKDVFGHGKGTTHAKVREKFAIVKHVDRVGRMADTLEFTELVLPLDRFDPELLEQLRELAPSVIDEQGDRLVVRHCYVERRMMPLNIYLERAGDEEFDAAVKDYGKTVRELALANIFPGDMLWRNFGVARTGRVVFYDYDEIDYLTICSFREIPAAEDSDSELSDDAWYGALPRDVFPEEFPRFLLGDPRIREAFMRHNGDLVTPEAWQAWKQAVETGSSPDFFPYDAEARFRNRSASR